MNDIHFKLSQMAEVAKSLNQARDDLGGLLALAEKRLVDLNIGVGASVELSIGVLSFTRKKSGEWGLIVEFDETRSELVHNVSTLLRIEAAKKLPELLAKMIVEAAKLVDEMQSAVAALRRFTE